jgi:hypothetical protein
VSRKSEQKGRGGRWSLGSPDSWRRIALTGIVGGVTVAFGAALVAALVGGGNDALDSEVTPPQPPASGPVDTGPVDVLPVDEPPPATLTLEATAPTEVVAQTETPAALETETPTVQLTPPVTTPEATSPPTPEAPTALPGAGEPKS